MGGRAKVPVMQTPWTSVVWSSPPAAKAGSHSDKLYPTDDDDDAVA